MAKVWARIRETIERHGSAGLLSIVGAAGSVPREPGARIVLQPDGGFFGTIGGGRLEYEAIAEARTALEAGRDRARLRDWPLGPNLGQCCGGMVKTLTETFDARDLEALRPFEAAEGNGAFLVASRIGSDGRVIRWLEPPNGHTTSAFDNSGFIEQFGDAARPVLLFGAGHVGRALVLALAPLPFAVRWIDGRPDQFPQYVPQNVVIVRTDTADRELEGAPRDALVIVMTHSHPLDFDITAAALRRDAFDFVGLIGSETKRARFVSFARQLGIADGVIERLVCPIGLPQIKGKEPAVIATALAAQLLMAGERISAPHLSPATQSA
jgi:xanthine dehydrogenase accessory factor